jgi:hypothetical protein
MRGFLTFLSFLSPPRGCLMRVARHAVKVLCFMMIVGGWSIKGNAKTYDRHGPIRIFFLRAKILGAKKSA